MCVGFTNGYDDFSSSKSEDALRAMVPGSAISFNRLALYHFAIFLGWALPKEEDDGSGPIPLICHLSGSANTKPMASVRLDNFRDVVQKSTVRVYKCSCSASKRSCVILQCLYRVGEAGYNAVTKNCEHFVRQVISDKDVSYQALWTMTMPLVQVPRIVAGFAFKGAGKTASSSMSSSCFSHSMYEHRSVGLINPEMDLIEIVVSHRGLNLKGVKLNSCCTGEFVGSFPMQMVYNCGSCSTESQCVVCKPCLELCHKTCQSWGGKVSDEPCQCTHSKRAKSSVIASLKE